jgi:class 3 adenylate cyclase
MRTSSGPSRRKQADWDRHFSLVWQPQKGRDERDTRKLAAILVSDVVGYSRLAGADEDRILARLRTLRSNLIVTLRISAHNKVGVRLRLSDAEDIDRATRAERRPIRISRRLKS